jgi:hypothetical protein
LPLVSGTRNTAAPTDRIRRAITLIGICSDRCNRQISAQSSTLNTLPIFKESPDSSAPRGHSSADADKIRSDDGKVAGAGVLVAPDLILTTAHVVTGALHITSSPDAPTGGVAVDFPAAPLPRKPSACSSR